jgi:hypothetical protein
MYSSSPPPHPHPSRVRAILEWMRTIYKLKENYSGKRKYLNKNLQGYKKLGLYQLDLV